MAYSGKNHLGVVTDMLTLYQYLLIESLQVMLILGREKRNTLGFDGYRHAHLISLSFRREPTGSANSRKEAPWGLVVTDTLT